ncbi:MAG TPA: rhombotarget lipoprotein [Steroidobacteraceae bacterium]|nr:rhombotarget lipoprotein [Steroidobacteraceae bacterium]
MATLLIRTLSLACLAIALSSCVSDGMCMWHCGDQRSGSTPLVEFLYPDGKVPPVDATPVLKIPLTVGLSFLPSRGGYERLDATQKEQLLASIKEHFRTRPYVRDIQIISEGYLNPHGGFDSLQQLARLQQLDVVALVSYDQVARQSENNRSLAYLTIVGAFLIRGSENETSTLLDLAVLDPSSRSLILRAAGTSHASGSSTAVRQSAEVQHQSMQGLDAAAQELNVNLDRELTAFAERVKSGTAPVRVVQRNGGGGALDVGDVMILLGATLLTLVTRRKWAP